MLNMPLHRPDKSNDTSKMPEKLKIFKLIFLVGKAYSEGFHSSQNSVTPVCSTESQLT